MVGKQPLDLGGKRRRVGKVDDADGAAADLVLVGRADAALGGADLVLALENLALLIQLAVIRENEVRRLADQQVLLNLDAELGQADDLAHEAHRVYDHSVADHTHLALAEDAGRDEVQDVLGLANIDGVTGVVAALRADDDVRLLRQNVDDLALALIAPLGAYENSVGHSLVLLSREIKIPEVQFAISGQPRFLRAEPKESSGRVSTSRLTQELWPLNFLPRPQSVLRIAPINFQWRDGGKPGRRLTTNIASRDGTREGRN